VSCILEYDRAQQQHSTLDISPKNLLRVTEHGSSPFLACGGIYERLQQQRNAMRKGAGNTGAEMLLVYSDSDPNTCRTPALHKEMQLLLDGLNRALGKVKNKTMSAHTAK